MKKLIAILLATLMLLSLYACASEPTTPATEAAPTTEATPATEAAPETTEAALPTATEIKLGETISLDFVEITFEECDIAADIQQSITVDHVTRITGPEPESGKQFIYLRGKIKNLNTSELPVFDFFAGEFDIDGYKYKCSANECDVLTDNGEFVYNIEPLTTYSFTMYAKIPDELANNNTSKSFRFGFYDLFDNAELASNISFEDDPISLCPYCYQMDLS